MPPAGKGHTLCKPGTAGHTVWSADPHHETVARTTGRFAAVHGGWSGFITPTSLVTPAPLLTPAPSSPPRRRGSRAEPRNGGSLHGHCTWRWTAA